MAAGAEGTSVSRRLGFGWRDALLALLAALVIMTWGTRAHERAAESHEDGRFVGILADSLHVAMGAVYGAFVRETVDAAELPADVPGGSGLFVHNEQTTESHAGTLLRPWEFALGRITRGVAPADPAAFVFHLERRLGVLFFCLGLAWLGSELFERFRTRAVFFALGTAGGNLYWLVEALGRPAVLRTWLDAYLPSVSGLGFSTPSYLLGVPHLAMELACVAAGVAGILAVGRQLRNAGTRAALPAALLGGFAIFGLAAIRPYSTPVLFGLAALHLGGWAWGGRGLAAAKERAARVRSALAPVGCLLLPALPMLAFDARALRGDSVFAALDVVHPSPPLLEQVLFLGAPVLGALLLLPFAWRQLAAPRARVLVAWLLLGTLLSNGAPLVAWEIEALSPMALVWLACFVWTVEGLLFPGTAEQLLVRRRTRQLGALVLVGLVLASGLWATHARSVDLEARLQSRDRFLWMSDEEAAVIDWLARQRAPGGLARDVALPGVWIEPRPLLQLVPWLAGTRVFLGHPDHTPESGRRLTFSLQFRTDGQGLDLLAAAGVTHLVSWPKAGRDPLDGHRGLRRVWEAGARIDLIQRAVAANARPKPLGWD